MDKFDHPLLAALAFTFAFSLSFDAQGQPAIPQLPSALSRFKPAVTPEQSAEAFDRLKLELYSDLLNTVVFSTMYRESSLTPEDREKVLRMALAHERPAVRQLAVEELQKAGALKAVLADALLELAEDRAPVNVETAILGLAELDLRSAPDTYIRRLIEVVATGDKDGNQKPLRASAEQQLARLWSRAIPVLLDIVLNKSENEAIRRAAAVQLSRLVSLASEPIGGGFVPRIPMGGAPPSWTDGINSNPSGGSAPIGIPEAGPSIVPDKPFGAPPTAPNGGDPTSSDPSPIARKLVGKEPQRVRVYFGTNREALVKPAASTWLPVAAVSGFSSLFLLLVITIGVWRKWSSTLLLRLAVVDLAFVAITGWIWNPWAYHSHTVQYSRGVVFGSREDPDGEERYGHCDVTLPPVGFREPGEMPMARPGLEDPRKHVILDRTDVLPADSFFREVQSKLAELKANERDVFIFVHGYNVDFREAACRTAQMSLDLKFKGLPMFFSWPSEGSLIGYSSDVDQVQGSVGPIKRFLESVARDVGAEKIHVLAHSKGGAAVSFAISQLDPNKRLFNQVILAAPDINANTFRKEIAPKLSQVALRSTLYCSQNDRALWFSSVYNRYKRAGDANDPLVIEPTLDTVDATGQDPSWLGHSYFSDCEPLINDIGRLFGSNVPPAERGLIERPSGEKMCWRFPSAASPPSRRHHQEYLNEPAGRDRRP